MTRPYEQLKVEEQLEKLPDLTAWGEGIEGNPRGYPLSEDDLDPETKKFNVTLKEDWRVLGARSGFNDGKDAWMFVWTFSNNTIDSGAKGQTAEVFYWFPLDQMDDTDWKGSNARKSIGQITKIMSDELQIIKEEDLKACENWDELFQLVHDKFGETQNRILTGSIKLSAYVSKKDDEFKGPYLNLGYLKQADSDEVPF